ncbi:MAG: phosphatase PAP2 family protein [Weeksellaceae bacterium]|nr:phosphatase PAP2 family protein [Weeksellaceae bacterium]
MQAWDVALLYYINQAGSPTWDVFWKLVSNTWVWIPLYFWLLYKSFKSLDTKSFIIFLLMVVLLIALTDQLAFYVKETLAIRLRPCHIPEIAENLRAVHDVCRGAHGFYSAHAANHAAIATLMMLSFRFRSLGIFILLVWTAFIGISRVYLGVHFPTDVLTGWFVGSITAFFFATLFKIWTQKEFW